MVLNPIKGYTRMEENREFFVASQRKGPLHRRTTCGTPTMNIIKAGAVHFLITLVFYILVKGFLGLSFTGIEASPLITHFAVPVWNVLMCPLAWFDSVALMMQGSGFRSRGVFAIMVTNSAVWGVAIALLLRGVEHIKDRRYAAR